MNRRARWALLSLFLPTACFPSLNPPSPGPPGSALGMCGQGDAIDTRALLRENARAFGSYEDVNASLPRTFEGKVEDDGHLGTASLYLDKAAHRLDVFVGGKDPLRLWKAFVSSGIDAQGGWEIPMTGPFARTTGDDSDDAAVLAFIFRREYLRLTPRDAACKVESGRPLVWMTFVASGPAGRTFHLAFEPDTARVVEYELSQPSPTTTCETRSTGETSFMLDCRRRDREYGVVTTWPMRGAAVASFPTVLTLTGPVTQPITFARESPGLTCAGHDCTRAATPVMETRWPDSGTVSVPMLFYGNEPFVRVDIQGKRTWGVVDSGTSMFALDSHAELGKNAQPAFKEHGAGATQAFEFGATELAFVGIGTFSFAHVPVAVAPLPPMDAYSLTRPQALIGLPLFQAAAVRMDFAAGEMVLAKDGRQLPQDGERFPLRLTRGHLVVRATVNGITDDFQIDTGDANSVSLEEEWVRKQKLTDLERARIETSKSGAGTMATTTARFPLRDASLGPLHVDGIEADVSLDAPPQAGTAGRLGNGFLSRCAAITLDVPGRAMWLTPPCTPKPTTTVKTSNVAFVLDHVDDFEETPWILSRVDDTSAFYRAGLRAGDRLLSIDDKGVGLSLPALQRALDVAIGTTVTIRVLRAEQRLTFQVTRGTGSP